MTYVTSVERLAKQEGIEQGILRGLRESIIETLMMRFTAVPDAVQETLEQTDNPAQLKQWLRLAMTVESIEAFQRAIIDSSAQ
jgi:hypothetical protein